MVDEKLAGKNVTIQSTIKSEYVSRIYSSIKNKSATELGI
jgi:hypothetical protein